MLNRQAAPEPKVEKEWLPRHSGTCKGYIPEYFDADKNKWLRIEVSESLQFGVPYPRFEGGVLKTIFMFGFDQATSLAHFWAACRQAEGALFKEVKVRVVEYEVVYEIKAREVEQQV